MINQSIKLPAIAVTLATVVCSTSQAQVPGYVDIESDVGVFQPVTLGDNVSLDPCNSQFNQQTANANTPQVSVGSICDNSSNDTNVSLHYLISSGSTTHALRFGSDFNNVGSSIRDSLVLPSGGTYSVESALSSGITSSPYSLGTGAGTLFSTAGTYVISLIAAVRSTNSYVLNIGGSLYRPGTDSGLQVTGSGIDVNGVSVGNFNGITVGSLGGANGTWNALDANGRRNLALSQTTLVVQSAAPVPEPSSLTLLLGGLLFGWRRRTIKRCNNLG